LADYNTEDSLTAEVEGRLDNIFKENDNVFLNEKAKPYPDNYPLIELKSLVLSLEWEITDEVITDFLIHTNNLIEFYHNDKVNLTFLKILRSLGKYIGANRSKSHPDSIKILHSTFTTLDHVIQKEKMSLPEKRQMLKCEIDKYNELRRLIIGNKLSNYSKANQDTIISADSEIIKDESTNYSNLRSENNRLIITQKQLNELKNEIIQFLRSEFELLKEDFRQGLNVDYH
jgi:hypothetical protein